MDGRGIGRTVKDGPGSQIKERRNVFAEGSRAARFSQQEIDARSCFSSPALVKRKVIQVTNSGKADDLHVCSGLSTVAALKQEGKRDLEWRKAAKPTAPARAEDGFQRFSEKQLAAARAECKREMQAVRAQMKEQRPLAMKAADVMTVARTFLLD